MPGTNDTACGGYGEGCRDCTRQRDDHCVDHVCATSLSHCDPGICINGCCATIGGKNVCADGQGARACGQGGAACVDCVAMGLTCDSPKCVTPVCSQ